MADIPAGIAACTTITCRSSVDIGQYFAAHRIAAGASTSRTSAEPTITRQLARSSPTRSIIEQPVIKIAIGNAPTPTSDIAFLTAPVT